LSSYSFLTRPRLPALDLVTPAPARRQFRRRAALPGPRPTRPAPSLRSSHIALPRPGLAIHPPPSYAPCLFVFHTLLDLDLPQHLYLYLPGHPALFFFLFFLSLFAFCAIDTIPFCFTLLRFFFVPFLFDDPYLFGFSFFLFPLLRACVRIHSPQGYTTLPLPLHSTLSLYTPSPPTPSCRLSGQTPRLLIPLVSRTRRRSVTVYNCIFF
jgi:hypothetical protein